MADTMSDIKTSDREMVIIAIGSSVGGLDALYKLLSDLPEKLEHAAIIIAQHLSPTYESQLVNLLVKKTELDVLSVTDGTRVVPGTIYVTPRDRDILYKEGKLQLVYEQDVRSNDLKPSIDNLFNSLSEGRQKNIGIILSGSNRDGVRGIEAIKKAGGYIIAQEPQTAEQDIMPLAAIDSGFVDYVLPPDEIGEEINNLIDELLTVDHNLIESIGRTDYQKEILTLLSKRTETNFEKYKPTTIFRRLHKRLTELEIDSLQEYLEFIKKNPQEIDALFNTILIGVTSFFRDKESFEQLEKVLKKLIAGKTRGVSIRVWVPGCATGEEPYSISIILHRILKNRVNNFNIQIFATDIDGKALAVGRKGEYSEESLKNVDSEILENYFTKKRNTYIVNKSIRSSILFSKHDVAVNPPFLKLDLISCRNLFIYFDSNLQKQIIPVFHYALRKEGYIFLGKAETIGTFTDLFSAVDAKNKLYQRKRGNKINTLRFGDFKTRHFGELKSSNDDRDTSVLGMVKETLYKSFPHPYVVINDNMDILEIKGDVQQFLGLPEGNMDTNIFRMAHESLQIDLRTVISQASKENVTASSKFRRNSDGDANYEFRVTAQPLVDGNHKNQLFMISFEKKMPKEDETPLIPTNRDDDPRIAELEEDLSATKENMQRYIEDLETSNEELQSLNEEMQSTYEELHTSNEELESTNEELQSSYDEIQSSYAELRAANQKLAKKETELRNSEANTWALLNNMIQSFVLLDRHYKIITFNEKAQKVFREILGKEMKPGKSYIDFITYENAEAFRNDMDKVFDGEPAGGNKTIMGKDGKIHWFQYHYNPVINKTGDVNGISCSLLDLTAEEQAKRDLLESEQLNDVFFESPSVGLVMTDEEGIIYRVNDLYCRISGYSRDELLGKPFTINIIPSEREKAMLNYKKFIQGEDVEEETKFFIKDEHSLDVMMIGILLTESENKRSKLTSIQDITDRKRYEVQLEQSVKEKEYMLQEIHHRVKNNMAVITGLLSLQSDSIEDEKIKKLYRESENRIRSIAMIHEKLYESQNFAAIEMKSYINDLVEMIMALVQPEADINTEIKAKKVFLNINSAIPCGLILHELIHNAFEHAFKGKKRGNIFVNFTHIDNEHCLIVEDDGIGLPEQISATKSKNLGMNLIYGLAKQLNSSIDIDRNNGTKFTFQFKDQ